MMCALLVLFGLAALAQDNPRVLEGSVVNSVTGLGIEGATVTLAPKSHNNGRTEPYRAETDAAGTFRISGVKPGEYARFVQKQGFLMPASSTFGGSFRIEQDAPPLRFELTPPATLRGRVIGRDGNPAPNVEVAIGSQYTRTVTTDENGAFIFEDLDPGSYPVLAKANHERTYFPATTDATLAEPILVRAGADQSGYEIHLQTARTWRVRGVVLDATGKPAPKALVDVLPAFDSPSALASVGETDGAVFSIAGHSPGVPPERDAPAVTGPDGVFEFPSVVEGDWTFRANSGDFVHAVPVSVRRDIDDLKIAFEAPFDLDGSVTLGDGSPPPPGVIILARLGSLTGMPTVTALTKERTLLFKNVSPGRYLIQTTAIQARYYVASVMAGTADVTNQAVSLNPASPPIRVIVKPSLTLTGTVEKGEGTTVVLVPQTLAPGDAGWLHGCNSGGGFEFTGLPPGDYYAIAVNSADSRLLRTVADIEGLRIIMRDATPVSVKEGAGASVHLSAPITLP